MIRSLQQRSKAAFAVSLLGFAAGAFVFLHSGQRSAATTLLAVLIWATFVYGCAQHARAKGHSGWWGPLVGCIGLIGLLPLLTLRDLRPDGIDPRERNEPGESHSKRAA